MAPDITHQDEAPPGSLGRAALGFALVAGSCLALMAVFYETMVWLKAQHLGYWAVILATSVYGALLIGIVALWSRSKLVRSCMVTSPAAKRYRRRMLAASSLYVAAIILATAAFVQHIAGPLAYLTAVLPALPVVGMFVSMGLYLREETDEFQRTVQIESSLWATGGIMVLAAGWGFLEMFRLAPHVEAWVLVPVWALFLGVANLFIRRRYR